jgi:uncharacterized protein (TIGR02646 family)
MAKRKPIKKMGVKAMEWKQTRIKWFQENASKDGYYYCHYCGVPMTMEECTLDHIKNRSSHKRLTHDFNNLVPCCVIDNVLKGSQDYGRFCERYYPRLVR